MQRFCDVFSRNNQLTIDLAATSPELMVDLRIINNSAWIIMDLYWFIRLLFTKEASCRQIIALCQTFQLSLNIVSETGEQTERCVSHSWIFGFSQNVSHAQAYDCPVSKCWYYAAHALHQHSIYFLLISTLHATKLVAKNLWFLTSRPGRTQGQGARTSQETQREETRNRRKGKIYCASRGWGQGVN